MLLARGKSVGLLLAEALGRARQIKGAPPVVTDEIVEAD